MMKSSKLQKVLYVALILVLLVGFTVSFLFNPSNRMSVEAKQSFLSINLGDNITTSLSPEQIKANALDEYKGSAITEKSRNQYEIDYSGTGSKIAIGDSEKSGNFSFNPRPRAGGDLGLLWSGNWL